MDTLIPSQKLAVSKVSYVCTLLETAGSMTTALPNTVLHANYLNVLQAALLIILHGSCSLLHTDKHTMQQEIFYYRPQNCSYSPSCYLACCWFCVTQFIWHTATDVYVKQVFSRINYILPVFLGQRW